MYNYDIWVCERRKMNLVNKMWIIIYNFIYLQIHSFFIEKNLQEVLMKQHIIGKHLIRWFQWYITRLNTPINEKNMTDINIWLVIHYTQYHAKKKIFFFAFLRMWEYQVFISINSWSRICNFYACTPKMNNDTLIFWAMTPLDGLLY